MKINDNTKLKVRIPKNLYESVKKELAKKKLQENEALQAEEVEPVQEVLMTAAVIPAVAALLGISTMAVKGTLAIKKEKNYQGFEGFLKAWKEFKAGQGDVAKKF